MIVRSRFWVSLGLCALVGGGCGSDSEELPGPAPLPTEVALEAFCDAIASADCGRLEACNLLVEPFDRSSCERRQALSCRSLQTALQVAVAAGQLAFAPAGGAACRDAVAARDCSVGFDSDLSEVESCVQMLTPLSIAGGACQVSLACGDGTVCRTDSGSCPGVCIAAAQLNESCSLTDPCAEPLYCSLTAMVCREPVGPGATCEAQVIGNSCRPGTFCDTSQPGQEVCAPVRGRNQGCVSPFECIEGARCVANRCSAGLEDDVCQAQSDCQPGFICAQERCRAPVSLDNPCDETAPCALGLTCTSTAGQSLCRPLSAPGDSCSGNDCFLGRCVEQTCVAFVDDGEACETEEQCFAGRVCDGACRPVPLCF